MRVLIVDDHLDTRVVSAAVISSMGHEVETAPTVAAALQAADQQPIDLLVCDIMLPDGTGYDLMRALSGRHRVRGIALTGLRTEEDVARCRDAGFDGHLAKPFDVERLEALVRDLAIGATKPPA